MVTTIDKAIVALIGGLLSVAATFGVSVDWATPEMIAGVGAVITALLTWLVPNKASS